MPRNDGYLSKVYGRRRRRGVAGKKRSRMSRAERIRFERSFTYPVDTRPRPGIWMALENAERQSVIILERSLRWMVGPNEVVDDNEVSPFVTIVDHEARLRGIIPVRDIVRAILMGFCRICDALNVQSELKKINCHFEDFCQSPDRITTTLIISSDEWQGQLFMSATPEVVKIARCMR